VTRAGGAIDVESEIGHGTTFTIAWPLSSAPTPAREPGPVASACTVGHETVWLVEDADDLRALLRDALLRAGYTVHESSNADDALAASATAAAGPHLLVTDVVLPGTNGRQLADILRRRYPDMRVLYVSGYTDDEVLRRGLPGVHFMAKPFSLTAFTETVRGILDGQATT
jgi:two-component system cell cycle sensor histidine kinase/response regulator CckA